MSSTRTFFVPVTFTVQAESAEDAAYKVADYLDEAITCVIDRYGMSAVDVETTMVTQYDPGADSVTEEDAPHGQE
jgi:hypothetical protein